MKLLTLIGEAPGGRIGDVPTPEGEGLTSSSGRNLCSIAGWDWDRFLKRADRRNLFNHPVDGWDARAARTSADRLLLELFEGANGRPVLLLGARVAAACSAAHWENYEWQPLGDLWRVARVPHPSGRNRLWNSLEERERAREFLKDLV